MSDTKPHLKVGQHWQEKPSVDVCDCFVVLEGYYILKITKIEDDYVYTQATLVMFEGGITLGPYSARLTVERVLKNYTLIKE